MRGGGGALPNIRDPQPSLPPPYIHLPFLTLMLAVCPSQQHKPTQANSPPSVPFVYHAFLFNTSLPLNPFLNFPSLFITHSLISHNLSLNMEAGLDLFTGGGGDSSNGSLSTVSKAEVVEQDFVGLSSEVSSCSAGEAELDLGLGLSLGGGGGGGVKVKPCAWGEYGRILTAKDFPSIMSAASSSSSSAGRVTTNPSPAPVAGTKRAADSSITQEGGSAHGVSQVVGWPPIRAYRINSLVNQSKVQAIEGDSKAIESTKNKDNMKKEIDNNNNNINGNAQEKGHLGKSLFVKANMDGIPIGRKVDLSVHASYESLSQTLENMFVSSNSTTNSFRSTESKGHTDEGTKASKLFDGSSEFVLTYEDKDGDWMLVGDVPWRMFLNTVKRLRIMRSSDANGLAPRFHQNGVRQRNKLS